jgi:hypothetical protein
MYYLRKERGDVGFVEYDADELISIVHDNEQTILYDTAMLFYDEYADVIKIIAKNNKFIPKYYPSITISVTDGVYIYWKDYSVRNKSVHLSEEKRKRIKGHHVQANKRLGYYEKSFPLAFKSELEVILKLESMFSVIRKKSKFLKKIDFYRNLIIKLDTAEIDEALDYIASKLDDE